MRQLYARISGLLPLNYEIMKSTANEEQEAIDNNRLDVAQEGIENYLEEAGLDTSKLSFIEYQNSKGELYVLVSGDENVKTVAYKALDRVGSVFPANNAKLGIMVEVNNWIREVC